MEPPRRVREVMREIASDLSMNSGMEAMMGRAKEFDSPLVAKLAGIGVDPKSRLHFEAALDAMWAQTTIPSEAPEVVIGGGLHASIYCAARVHQGSAKPLVIERNERAGGAFAVSRQPSFFLNSRNRPGELGVPRRDEALNFIPFAAIQPADLGGDEYQTNTEMAFAIRATLAMNAKVVTGRTVRRAENGLVILDDGTEITTQRAIWATGLGEPAAPRQTVTDIDRSRVLNYFQFLASLDAPFPMQGMKRVAVVGAGDAGKTVVEALLGQGPRRADTVASLDWVERIDWFGLSPEALDREGWEKCNRSRYRGIGRAMPSENGVQSARIVPSSSRAEEVASGYNGAYLDGVRYDRVIWCAGFPRNSPWAGYNSFNVGGREVAREIEPKTFTIGPTAQLPFNPPAGSADVAENTVALFRYADLTANFALAQPIIQREETA